MRLYLSLLLTYVQICGTLFRVTSTNSRLWFAPTPLFPYSCSLFGVAKKVNSFGIKQIQPLFPKHPGWGYRENRAFGINNLQLLFCRSCLRFSYERGLPQWLGASVAIQSAPFAASASTPRSLRLCVIFCLRSYPRPRTFASEPLDIQALRRSDFCYSAVP
jgi:hypothetical protein